VARLVGVAATGTRKSQGSAQRLAVAQALAALQSLRSGVTLDTPLREVTEAGRD